MKWIRWFVGVVAILGLAGLVYSTRQSVVTFAHLCDAQTWFLRAGFQCTPDCATGKLGSGFLLSRQSATWNEAGKLCKVGRMGPEWRGRVWVTFNTRQWQLQSIPEDAGTRRWGAIIAFGDPELLNELDGILTKSPLRIL